MSHFRYPETKSNAKNQNKTKPRRNNTPPRGLASEYFLWLIRSGLCFVSYFVLFHDDRLQSSVCMYDAGASQKANGCAIARPQTLCCLSLCISSLYSNLFSHSIFLNISIYMSNINSLILIEHYVDAEDEPMDLHVVTIEEESLFQAAYPDVVSLYQMEKSEALTKKQKSKFKSFYLINLQAFPEYKKQK